MQERSYGLQPHKAGAPAGWRALPTPLSQLAMHLYMPVDIPDY